MIEKPKILFKNLQGNSKILLLAIIREFSKNVCSELGLEATEEAMINLIDEGFLKICTDEEDNFWLELYDFSIEDYRKI
jgi:predicted nucleic acid-binding protein